MKKLQRALSVFAMMLTACLTLPSMAQAAETTKSIGDNLSLLYCIPFAGILLCIAICPLVAGEWWEKRKPIVVAFWSLAFLIPFAIAVGMGTAWEELLEAIIGDYLTFIVLLFGLFCVAGNVSLEGDLVGKPKLNVLLLIISTLLSSWIGTTGASMLMIRPMIRANKWRRRKVQVMVFFIFLVSNIGGCLTPVGDPPLLMGFMRGVPFTWSLRLFPVLVFNMVILLTVFYFIDRRAYRRDIALGMRPDISRPTTTFKVNGLHNIIFLIMCIPIVTIGANFTAMYYVTLQMIKNEETYIFRTYWKSFRENFKQATAIWLILLAVLIVLILDLLLVMKMPGTITYLRFVFLVLIFFEAMVLSYVFPVLSRFDNTVKNTIKNSILMAIRHLPWTIMILLVNLCPLLIYVFSTTKIVSYLILLMFLLGFSSVALGCSWFFVNKIFPFYMPEEEKEVLTPEEESLRALEAMDRPSPLTEHAEVTEEKSDKETDNSSK